MDRVDWVTQCARCTAEDVFKRVVKEFQHDINKVNASDFPRFKNGLFALVLPSESSCKIYWVPNNRCRDKAGPAIKVRCRSGVMIETFRDENSDFSDTFKRVSVMVEWDKDTSRCILSHGEKHPTLEPWQISQLFLHELFFNTSLS